MRAAVYTLVLVSLLSEVAQAETVFYLARPRAVGKRVPPSLLFDLQAKLKALIKRRNRLWSRAKRTHNSSPALRSIGAPFCNRFSARSARRARSRAARKALEQVIRDVGDLPLTPDAREVLRDVMVLQTEIAEAEQDLLLVVDQLPRDPYDQPRRVTGSWGSRRRAGGKTGCCCVAAPGPTSMG